SNRKKVMQKARAIIPDAAYQLKPKVSGFFGGGGTNRGRPWQIRNSSYAAFTTRRELRIPPSSRSSSEAWSVNRRPWPGHQIL
ncbi:MAG: hypothetical protein ACK48U_16370, partial [Planctomyces sp.]